MDYKKYNLDKLTEWRSTTDRGIRNRIEMDLMTVNRPVLEKYFVRWGDWALAEVYIQLTKALDTYDMNHPKMSFIGYWKQKLNWQLPKKSLAENTLIKLPYDATDSEKEQFKEMDYVWNIDLSRTFGDDKEMEDEIFLSDDSVNYSDEESQWD